MRKRLSTLFSLATVLLATQFGLLVAPFGSGPRRVGADDPPLESRDAAQLFGLEKVWPVELHLSAEAWKEMEPPPMSFPFGPPPGSGQKGAPAEKRAAPGQPAGNRPRGFGFNIEFEYVRGQVKFAGQEFADVGVRFKGNSSYMSSAGGIKRPFKLDFDRFAKNPFPFGLSTINLNNNSAATAPTCEAIAYSVYHAAGAPAPRTAFAEVWLTVDGKHDRELLGLYTVVEQVDERFLQDRYGKAKGMLLKPEGVRGIEYLGDEWQAYEDRYQPKNKVKASEKERLIEFARFVEQSSDDDFSARIDEYLDLPAFVKYLAATVVVSNLDSPLMIPHNYYLFLHPETNKFHFIPWDLNLSFGGMMMFGGTDDRTNLSIEHPYAGESRFFDRLFALDRFTAAYREELARQLQVAFNVETTGANIDRVLALVKPIAEREAAAAAKRPAPPMGGFGFGPPGKAPAGKGPSGKVGSAGGPAGKGRPRGPGGFPGFGPPVDLRQFVSDRVASIEAQLAGKREGFVPRGFGPPGGPGGGGRPGGNPDEFGPGMFLAPPLLAAVDADGNSELSLDEARGAAEKLFASAENKSGDAVDRQQFVDAIYKILPRPDFGPIPIRDEAPGKTPEPESKSETDGKTPEPESKSEPDAEPPAFEMPDFIRMQADGFGESLFPRLDEDKDGRITRDDVLRVVAALFESADKDKSKSLSESELRPAINRLQQPPRFFGPPGTPPDPVPPAASPAEAGKS